jgi:hypothetical protein
LDLKKNSMMSYSLRTKFEILKATAGSKTLIAAETAGIAPQVSQVVFRITPAATGSAAMMVTADFLPDGVRIHHALQYLPQQHFPGKSSRGRTNHKSRSHFDDIAAGLLAIRPGFFGADSRGC